MVSQATSDVTTYGDEVAETIKPGSTEDDVRVRHEHAQKRAQERCSKLEQEVKSAVEAEQRDLLKELETLHEGSFARQLRGRIETARVRERGSDRNTEGSRVEGTPSPVTTPSERLARLQKVGNIAQTIGKYTANWTTGPFAATARLGSATAARGSQAHHVIYSVGKFFGANFKPWGAVNAARILSKAGRVIGVAGAILAVFAQIKEKQQQEEQKRQLRDARDSVRQAYRQTARQIEVEFWTTYEHFSHDFYEGELEAIDEALSDLVGERQARNEMAGSLNQIASEAQVLIRQIQAGVVTET